MIELKLLDAARTDDEPLNKSFDWEVISYSSKQMMIKLNFEEPINIS